MCLCHKISIRLVSTVQLKTNEINTLVVVPFFWEFKGFTIFLCFLFFGNLSCYSRDRRSHCRCQLIRSWDKSLLIGLLSVFRLFFRLSLAEQLRQRVPDAAHEESTEQVLERHEGVVDAQQN